MKKVTLQVVKSKPDGVTDEQFKAAKRMGEIECNAVTAMENLALGKGLYEVKPEPELEVTLAGLKDPSDMSPAELVQEMTMWGKPPRKKMNRTTMEKFIRNLRENAENLIIDDTEDDDDDDDNTDDGQKADTETTQAASN